MLRSDFTYNGRALSDFYMKMYDPDEQPSMPSRTIEKSEIGTARQRPQHYGAYFSDVKPHHFRLIHDPEHYESSYAMRLTDREIDEVISWLMQPEYPEDLVVATDDETISVIYRGLFTDVKYFVVGEDCYGLDMTFTCDAPYGYSPLISKRFKVQSATAGGIFTNDLLPRAEFLAPTIMVTNAGTAFHDESLTITNVTDKEQSLTITLPDGYYALRIDCEHRRISAFDEHQAETVLRLSDLGLSVAPDDLSHEVQSFVLYWPRLLRSDNRFEFVTDMVNPDLTIEIQTRHIIHAGGF